MLQIKTIWDWLDNATYFDNEVNAALRDGWTLKKRTVQQHLGQKKKNNTYVRMMLYAELEMEVADDDVK